MFETPRYRVTGQSAVLGHESGAEFEDDLEPAHEARLLAGGHLTRLTSNEGEPDATVDDDEAAAVAEAPDETPQSAANEGDN
jgi:hypothetical protein